MQIEHLAMWTADLERLKAFYVRFFHVQPGPKYVSTKKGFESYFLQFASGARLEIMRVQGLIFGPDATPGQQRIGLAHLAISVGSRLQVDELTNQLRAAGVVVLDGPRQTGDGLYESVVQDPDGNRVEITV